MRGTLRGLPTTMYIGTWGPADGGEMRVSHAVVLPPELLLPSEGQHTVALSEARCVRDSSPQACSCPAPGTAILKPRHPHAHLFRHERAERPPGDERHIADAPHKRSPGGTWDLNGEGWGGEQRLGPRCERRVLVGAVGSWLNRRVGG